MTQTAGNLFGWTSTPQNFCKKKFNYGFIVNYFLLHARVMMHGPIELNSSGLFGFHHRRHLKFWAQLFRALGLEAYDIIETAFPT